jgi:hypothetical protein
VTLQPIAPETLFTTETPGNDDKSDNGANYELGMKFQSGIAGWIAGIRYWRSPSDAGSHIGNIWSASGTLLTSVTFRNETASGWQQQRLTTPLHIDANTTDVVTVNGNGYYPQTIGGLTTAVSNGDLSSVPDGNNGVYGPPGQFPTNTWNSSNYFRDVTFFSSFAAAQAWDSASP